MKQKLANQRPAVEMREVPPIDKPVMPPPEFVRSWITMFGSFADGKIEKSRAMKSSDLNAEDAKFLLQHISVEQLAKQYSMTDDEITEAMQYFGLIKLSTPNITPIPDDEIWFTESAALYDSQHNRGPILRIGKSVITINSALRHAMGGKVPQYVQFGVTPDNQIKMKVTDKGLKVHATSDKNITWRVSCAPLIHLLTKRGIMIPAVYKMALKEFSGCWIGVLSNEPESKA